VLFVGFSTAFQAETYWQQSIEAENVSLFYCLILLPDLISTAVHHPRNPYHV